MKLSEVMSMRQCRWVRSHLSHYLDRDPAMPLSQVEIDRLQAHIAICERCASLSADFQDISIALSHYRQVSDIDAVKRLSETLAKFSAADDGTH